MYVPTLIPMLRRIALSIALLPAAAAAQDRSGDQLFTWSGQIASGQTFSVRHFNGPIDVREGTGDRVEFRADRRSRHDLVDRSCDGASVTSGEGIAIKRRMRNRYVAAMFES